jgi:hypothetical protein
MVASFSAVGTLAMVTRVVAIGSDVILPSDTGSLNTPSKSEES